LSTSLKKQKLDIDAIYEDFCFYHDDLDARITFLAEAVGESEDYPYPSLV